MSIVKYIHENTQESLLLDAMYEVPYVLTSALNFGSLIDRNGNFQGIRKIFLSSGVSMSSLKDKLTEYQTCLD